MFLGAGNEGDAIVLVDTGEIRVAHFHHFEIEVTMSGIIDIEAHDSDSEHEPLLLGVDSQFCRDRIDQELLGRTPVDDIHVDRIDCGAHEEHSEDNDDQ